MPKQRIQKKMEGPIGTDRGWDPLGNANLCLAHLKKDVERCDAVGTIVHTGCIYGNAEAAFYEHQASEDEMVSLKDFATELRHEFGSKCKCDKRKI